MTTNLPIPAWHHDVWPAVVATLAALGQVTVTDMERVGEALNLDPLELIPAVMERRRARAELGEGDAVAEFDANRRVNATDLDRLARDQEIGDERRKGDAS